MSESLEKAFHENLAQNLNVSTLDPEVQKYLKDLSKQQKNDFASSTGGYFSPASQEFIARESAQRLARALGTKNEVDLQGVQDEWQKIVRDFYQNQYWNQPTQKEKPAKVLSEEQKRTREIFPYIWIAFQALIAMKLVISYFGLESADSPDETPWLLYLAIAFSFCSLVIFAWRKYRKGE